MALHQRFFERFAGALALFSIALVVSGTKACQEDYDLGSQTTATGTRTASPTPTEEDDGGIIPRSTPTPFGTPASVTPTATTTPTPAAAVDIDSGFDPLSDSGSSPSELMQELALLGEKSAPAPAPQDPNWLGDSFSRRKSAEQNESDPGVWLDSDGDGFSDTLETDRQSLPMDALSVPEQAISTSIDERVRSLDSDFDGVSNEDEQKYGTNPKSLDSDNDGNPDGAELLSDGNPLVGDSYPDRDHDGLSDAFERNKGINHTMADTDNDGLRDDLELVVSSDPSNPDTDGDRISDGKEFDLASDPTIAEEVR